MEEAEEDSETDQSDDEDDNGDPLKVDFDDRSRNLGTTITENLSNNKVAEKKQEIIAIQNEDGEEIDIDDI